MTDVSIRVDHVTDMRGVGRASVTALVMEGKEALLAAGYANGGIIVWDLQVNTLVS